jgi:predicted metalloprotease with PDZ domain
MGLQEARGFLITDVIKEGPSDKAGIRGGYIITNINGTEIELGGDLILEIDNKTVRTINDILTYLNTQKRVGDTVQLTVLRDGQLQEIPVTLAASSTLPEFANPEAPLPPDESLPAPPLPPPSQPPDNDGLFGNLYDECVKMASKEICDLLFRR